MAVSQQDIADKIGVDRTTVNKVLNRYPHHKIPAKTIDLILEAADEIGYNIERLRKSPDRREHTRKAVDLRADLTFYLEDRSIYDRGTGQVRDLSLAGALLSEIETSKQNLPIARFTCMLTIKEKTLEGLVLEGVFRRYEMSGAIEFGLKWDRVGKKAWKRLKEFLHEPEAKAS